jgi:hypothetical protein
MTYAEAMADIYLGKMVKLPEWTGYWFKGPQGNILVMTRKGDVLDTPHLEDYKGRTDWEETDGLRDFGGALIAIRAGKKVKRVYWAMDEFLHMGENGLLLSNQTYIPSMDEILACDWEILP